MSTILNLVGFEVVVTCWKTNNIIHSWCPRPELGFFFIHDNLMWPMCGAYYAIQPHWWKGTAGLAWDPEKESKIFAILLFLKGNPQKNTRYLFDHLDTVVVLAIPLLEESLSKRI